jgi:hypothetical protein
VPLYKAAFDAQTWWMQCSSRPKLSFWMPLPINIICSAIHIIQGQSYFQGQSYQPKGWCCAKVGTIQLLPVNKVFHSTQ